MSESATALHVRLPELAPAEGRAKVASALTKVLRHDGRTVTLKRGPQRALGRKGPDSYLQSLAIVATEKDAKGWVSVHLTSSHGSKLSAFLAVWVIEQHAFDESLGLRLWNSGECIDFYDSAGSRGGARSGRPACWEDLFRAGAHYKDLARVWSATRRTGDVFKGVAESLALFGLPTASTLPSLQKLVARADTIKLVVDRPAPAPTPTPDTFDGETIAAAERDLARWVSSSRTENHAWLTSGLRQSEASFERWFHDLQEVNKHPHGSGERVVFVSRTMRLLVRSMFGPVEWDPGSL